MTAATADAPPSQRRGLRDATARLAVVATGAVLLGAVRLHRPAELRTLCVLRATTGVPCPACGGTTAFVRVGQGRLLDGVLANPFALLAALALVLAPTGALRPLRRLSTRATWALAAGFVAASWVWQLGRFGYV